MLDSFPSSARHIRGILPLYIKYKGEFLHCEKGLKCIFLKALYEQCEQPLIMLLKNCELHILRQPKSGIPGSPHPPPSAMVCIWLIPPPGGALPSLVSNCQHLAYPPYPFVSFRQHLPDAPFVLQFSTWTFLRGIFICMGPICMLHGFDEHVWLNLNQFSSLPAFFLPITTLC